MILSRKEFFRQGLFSLGDTILGVAGVRRQESDQSGILGYSDNSDDTQPRYAVPVNDRCLARSCGCFSCMERCESQAITMAAGAGINIDATRCNGCGDCYDVCPVVPKSIRLIGREN